MQIKPSHSNMKARHLKIFKIMNLLLVIQDSILKQPKLPGDK